jgi:hypothetical protein
MSDKDDKKTAAEAIFKLCSYDNLGPTTNYDLDQQTSSVDILDNIKYQKILAQYCENQISEAIHKRSSSREFNSNNISDTDLGKILFDAYSLKGASSYTIPQAGGIGCMELIVLSRHDNTWDISIHDPRHYDLKKQNDKIDDISKLFYTKSIDFDSAHHCVIIACDIKKLSDQYLARAYKFACFQAGHIAQNIILRATQLNIGSVVLGSLIESEINSSCTVLKKPYPLYAVVM